MRITYKKLWKKLIDNGMKKTDLLSIMSSRTLAKLSKGKNISTDLILKICEKLNCDICDIMETEK